MSVIVSLVITLFVAFFNYGNIRSYMLNDVAIQLEQQIEAWMNFSHDDIDKEQYLGTLLATIKQRDDVKFVGLYNQSQQLIRHDSSLKARAGLNTPIPFPLSEHESLKLSQAFQNSKPETTFSPEPTTFSINGLPNKFLPESLAVSGLENITYFKLLRFSGGNNQMLRIVSDTHALYHKINTFSVIVTASLFLLSFCFIILLFWTLYRARQTIHDYQDDLHSQLEKLSAVLEENQGLQKSMRTASSRAIEMNEQFLRKVGADLHDGPAQSIGYAVLSLDRVNKADDNSDVFNQQYHSVKEALSYSIEEIRTIAAGLVLPQIESLSLPESIIKVIRLHEKNSGMKVNPFFKDLPEDISVPIKICAYRLVQEGLNNASRHGKAKLSRVSVSYANERLQLIIKDNGTGFKVGEQKVNDEHLGLMGLQDRIESLGGSFVITSEPGVGSLVKATIPIHK